MGSIRRPTYTSVDPATGEKVKKVSRVWWIRYNRAGKRHEESSGSTKKSKAIELLKLREGAVAEGKPVTAAASRLRIEDALADVVRDHKLQRRKTTADVERRIRLHILRLLGGRRMASISSADLRAYAATRLEEGAKPATINRELAVLRRAFALGLEAGTVLSRPKVSMLEERNVRQGFFSRAEFEAVREELPAHLRPVVTFAFWTGWRVPSEVLTLEWRGVDREAREIRLEPGTTKTGRGRVLPYDLLPELVEVIEAQWAEHQRLAAEGVVSPFVFPHADGRPIRCFRAAWASACERAGVPGRLVHDFRRTAARNLTAAGVPQNVAMRVTGHVTPSVFHRYSIVAQEDVREGLGRLADSMAGGKEVGKSEDSGRVRRFPKAG